MKLMNSDTHSWTVSLASFAIFAFAGSAFFIILLIFAIGKNRSCSRTVDPLKSSSSISVSTSLYGGIWYQGWNFVPGCCRNFYDENMSTILLFVLQLVTKVRAFAFSFTILQQAVKTYSVSLLKLISNLQGRGE